MKKVKHIIADASGAKVCVPAIVSTRVLNPVLQLQHSD